jgi:hypothetical protein
MELTNVGSYGKNGTLYFYRAGVNEAFYMLSATSGLPVGMVNQNVTLITTAKTLTASDCGYVLVTSVDDMVITLPSATGTGLNYTIINTASDGGALLKVKGAVPVLGNGAASASDSYIVASNTKATHKYGDAISVTLGWVTTNAWFITNLVGTWAMATAT